MVFLFSKPLVAGFVMITFPTPSTSVSNCSFLPKSTMNSITRSSFFEGRGTAFKLEK